MVGSGWCWVVVSSGEWDWSRCEMACLKWVGVR